jgi:hypothetical protein
LSHEHTIIESALRQNPLEFRDCISNFEKLTKLQHYGLGTRLLDVTLNPLVALFFATEFSEEYIKNANEQFDHQEHDGKVFYKFVNGSSLQDLHIKVALEIPFIEFGKSLSLEKFCNHLVKKEVFYDKEHEKIAANDYDIVIKQLKTNSFIVATNSNVRLVQQRGAFLFPTAINIKTGNDIKTSILSKAKKVLDDEFDGFFIIPTKDKEEIRKELDFFNINEATLFPELEHQMKYIQSQTLYTEGIVEEYQQDIKEIKSSNAPQKNINEDDIRKIITQVLGNIDVKIQDKVYNTIDKIQIDFLDWQIKDTAKSNIKRDIKKIISEEYSPEDVINKTNEIVNKLLEVR